jgi:anaerobic magnesium-protoporphyrin IX monomethyl ester cyclase
MRLAGCERMSLGVESGSARILNLMDKKLSPEQVLRSRELAKKWGIAVRFYMMVGSRGETQRTLGETLRFLEKAKPNQYMFSALAVTPGTRDFELAVKQGWLNAEDYFRENFQELRTTFDASDEDTDYLRDWFEKNKGLHEPWFPSVADCKEVAARLPDHAPAELDVAAACLREGDLAAAEVHALRALAMKHPTPGVALNLLASVARRRGDARMMRERLEKAVAWDPQHLVVQENALALRQWLSRGGGADDLPDLSSDMAFGVLERPMQPTLPAKMPDDFAVWQEAAPPPRP